MRFWESQRIPEEDERNDDAIAPAITIGIIVLAFVLVAVLVVVVFFRSREASKQTRQMSLVPEFFSSRRRQWSEARSKILGFQSLHAASLGDVCEVLPADEYVRTIQDLVQKLNGSRDCQQGFCAVYCYDQESFCVLWRSDKDAEVDQILNLAKPMRTDSKFKDRENPVFYAKGAAGAGESFNGAYTKKGQCNWKSKFKQVKGNAIVYFDIDEDAWVMNVTENKDGWAFRAPTRGSHIESCLGQWTTGCYIQTDCKPPFVSNINADRALYRIGGTLLIDEDRSVETLVVRPGYHVKTRAELPTAVGASIPKGTVGQVIRIAEDDNASIFFGEDHGEKLILSNEFGLLCHHDVMQDDHILNGRHSMKQGAKRLVNAITTVTKVSSENKIGMTLKGWSRDVGLLLQEGISAQGKGHLPRFEENFEAPQQELFSRCRAACGITAARYFEAMGLQDGLTEPNLCFVGSSDAAGKSGSFFFLSPDQQFMAKSCTAEDWDTLLKILPDYTNYLEAARMREAEKVSATRGMAGDAGLRGFTETLLPKFLGLYKLILVGSKDTAPIRVIVMINVYGGSVSIARRYDLKGSTTGRLADDKELTKRHPVLKDWDWIHNNESALCMARSQRNALMKSIDLDVTFLADHGLIDYSFIVGIHDMSEEQEHPREAMNVVTVRDSSRHCYVGIIDILTPYGVRKKAETFFCGQLLCGRDISCQPPDVYARRFNNFLDKRVFASRC
jgi:hypothetical protein